MHELVDALAPRDIEMARTFLEFLRERRHSRRPQPKAGAEPAAAAAVQPADPE